MRRLTPRKRPACDLFMLRGGRRGSGNRPWRGGDDPASSFLGLVIFDPLLEVGNGFEAGDAEAADLSVVLVVAVGAVFAGGEVSGDDGHLAVAVCVVELVFLVCVGVDAWDAPLVMSPKLISKIIAMSS